MLSFLQTRLYIRLSPERVSIRNIRSGEEFDCTPWLATRDEGKPPEVLACGDEALALRGQPGIRVSNPFAHPRSLLSDFTRAELLLRHLLARFPGHNRWLRVAPQIILHPLGDPAGGYTQIEIRALQELGLGAGALKVWIWQGPPFSAQDLLAGSSPAGGQWLGHNP